MAVAIHKNCACSLLKAQRLALSWTLEEMVREVVRTADLAGLPPPNLTTQRICHWEAGERPHPDYLDLLCRLFQTRPDRLGFGNDHTPAEDLEPPVTVVLPPAVGRVNRTLTTASGKPDAGENEGRRRTLLQASVGNRGVLSAQLLDAVDAIRRQGEQVFEQTALTAATLDRLEEAAHGHGLAHVTSPPLAVLCDLAADYIEVQQGLASRLAADLRQRLCRIAAQLAGLIALVFADVNRSSQARGWYYLGHQAADENGDRVLRAWLRAVEAFEPLFLGDYPRAIQLAQQAQALTRQSVSPGSVLGYAIEARALARLGRSSEALAALRYADVGFERLDVYPDASSSWLGYPQAAYLYHRGDILTRLGMVIPAQKDLGDAAAAYGTGSVRGLAYVEFCRASCDIGYGHVSDGCERALSVLLDVPVDHRVAMVKVRAREVYDAVPPGSRNTRTVRGFKEALRGM
jgi:tetratricopeptide (TPR) repeat protein